MEAVAQAVQKARYNEAVIVNVASEENGASREIILTATLDETNGGVVWNDVAAASREGSSDDDVGIVRHLRTKRWVIPMLNDKRRNELYDEAIRAASREAVKRFKSRTLASSSPTRIQEAQCIHALDIGTGTGLLAMMVSKHTQAALLENFTTGPSPSVEVTSLEMASAMARLAKLTVASNGMQDTICVLEEHSCETSLPHKSLICTSELLESALLGEGILPALRDAWRRHLHPEAVIVPQRARVYTQLIESRTLVGNYRGPYPSDCVRLCTSSDEKDVMLGGDVTSAGQGITVPLHAESLFSSESAVRQLTEPTVVMDLAFSKDSMPGPEGDSRVTQLLPCTSGVAHGVLFWWELDLWDNLTYSTQQGKEPWQDHWQQCLFVFPTSNEECPRLSRGQPVELRCSYTDSGLSFMVENTPEPERPPKRPRQAHVDEQLIARLISPERALLLNETERISLLRQAIHTALQIKGLDVSIVDISDFSLCAILAALEGATQVTSLETSSGEIPITSARVAQIANGLPLKWNDTIANFQILQCHAEQLTVESLNNHPADIVAAEPYYELLEGWSLQEALNYFYLVRSLRERGLITRSAISIPSYASVMVCGIQCENLAQAYRACGDENEMICGFKHAVVNKYGNRFHQHDISLRACEYEHTVLTEKVQVARISFEEPCSITGNNTWTRLPFLREGTCHGILCWIDYGLRIGKSQDDCSFHVLSTNTPYHRQLFRMLPCPVSISKEDMDHVTFLFRARLGGLDGLEDHQFDVRIENES